MTALAPGLYRAEKLDGLALLEIAETGQAYTLTERADVAYRHPILHLDSWLALYGPATLLESPDPSPDDTPPADPMLDHATATAEDWTVTVEEAVQVIPPLPAIPETIPAHPEEVAA